MSFSLSITGTQSSSFARYLQQETEKWTKKYVFDGGDELPSAIKTKPLQQKVKPKPTKKCIKAAPAPGKSKIILEDE